MFSSPHDVSWTQLHMQTRKALMHSRQTWLASLCTHDPVPGGGGHVRTHALTSIYDPDILSAFLSFLLTANLTAAARQNTRNLCRCNSIMNVKCRPVVAPTAKPRNLHYKPPLLGTTWFDNYGDDIFTARRYSSCLRVSVRLSVTRRYCIKTAKRRITETTLHDSPENLIF